MMIPSGKDYVPPKMTWDAFLEATLKYVQPLFWILLGIMLFFVRW